MKREITVLVEGRELRLSNLEKVLYPQTGFTKAEVIDYYRRIAPFLIPHLREKPLTIKRWPDGVEGESFFEKQCPRHRPPWVKTAPLFSERRGRPIEYCVCADLPTLIWLANLAALELHVGLSAYRQPERPLSAVFDLDPGPPAGLPECAAVALRIRDALLRLGLQSLAKASGKAGLHVFVPLNSPVTYEETRALARGLGRALEAETPDRVTTVMRKELRHGKVFVDWSQNHAKKTTVAPYSLRGTPIPRASAPLTWEEVEAISRKELTDLDAFLSPEAVLRRAEREGDRFRPLLELTQRLPLPAPAH